MNRLSEDEVSKILDFLRKNPHFFDESNPLFYNPIQKNAEKRILAESFEPPIDVFMVSAKIRYIINKVIDDFYLIKKGKRSKWQYFEKAKFMLPALMTKFNPIYKNNDDENCSDGDINDYNKLFLKNNIGNENFSKSSVDSEISNEELGICCKICDFCCQIDQFSPHFQLYYHRKGEENWKKRNEVQEIQCPYCKKSYKYWYIFFEHIESEHQLKMEDINHKVFTTSNKRLSISLDSTVSKGQLFYEKRL